MGGWKNVFEPILGIKNAHEVVGVIGESSRMTLALVEETNEDSE